MNYQLKDLIKNNLLSVIREISIQKDIGKTFPEEKQCFNDQIEQIYEYINDADEYAIAYEIIVCLLEDFPFKINGPTAIKLLEVGLLMKYKTEKDKDSIFNNME